MTISNFIKLYRSSNSLSNLVNSQVAKDDIVINEYVNTYMYDYKDSIDTVKEKFKHLALKVMEYYPEYELNEEKINSMCEACTYYDIGIYSVPKRILNKKTLTNEEIDILKKYPIYSSKLIDIIYGDSADENTKRYATNISLYYHENFDGTGYPNNVKEEEIPIEAQIASICITYVNLKNMNDDALNKITTQDSNMFNPKLIECFKEVIGNN